MSLLDLLPRERVLVPLTSRAKAGVVDELLAALPLDEKAREAARAAVFDREAAETTGIGRGVAVPHGWTPEVTGHMCAFGIAPEPVDWGAIDGGPCRIFFMTVANPSAAPERAGVLARLATILNDPAAHESLRGATTPEQVLGILAARPETPAAPVSG